MHTGTALESESERKAGQQGEAAASHTSVTMLHHRGRCEIVPRRNDAELLPFRPVLPVIRSHRCLKIPILSHGSGGGGGGRDTLQKSNHTRRQTVGAPPSRRSLAELKTSTKITRALTFFFLSFETGLEAK